MDKAEIPESRPPFSRWKILTMLACTVLTIALAALTGSICCTFSRENTVAVPGTRTEQKRFPVRFNNGKTVRVRLALTEIERLRGLMGCRALPENEGMLFVYPDADQRAFWMKNVPVDLDIGYFNSAGKLLEVYTMQANNTASVYSNSDDIRFCLEMNRDWFKKNKILPENNASLDLDSIREAMRERNFTLK